MGVRYRVEASTFHRESNLSPSTQAAQLTKHLIPGQGWTLEHHFFELATWGTKDDFHDVFSLLVYVRSFGPGTQKLRLHLECHSLSLRRGQRQAAENEAVVSGRR